MQNKCQISLGLSISDKCELPIKEESDKEMCVHLYLLPTPCVYVQIERGPGIGSGTTVCAIPRIPTTQKLKQADHKVKAHGTIE